MKAASVFTICILVSFTLKASDMIDSIKSVLKQKDISKTIALIQAKPEILETSDKNGSSGFMLIAYSGLQSALEEAISLKKAFTFHEAIVSGQIAIVGEYLNNKDKAFVNLYSSDGFTPLSLAAFFDQTEIAILLLENGADPNLQATNPSKVNALHSAVAKENLDLCKKLIDFGVNVNAVQMQNVTALHSASHRGNLELVKLLVENGADTELKMENGDSALSIAERENKTEVAEYLKQK
ncbi:ankyrin repeat domain-containing protein [Chondrinema litorale]|uniref:ankyrin repeat domain-containing protein n=1 Tax=Chondrinema litorale TaxID=2994555 RepID=UPI002542C1EC|nr:ankyrin repeat domain-containing protein [Chondrinema litorale]UZR98152.1 ankyrin repeat domain-containing protein [Chondrinema litorale]